MKLKDAIETYIAYRRATGEKFKTNAVSLYTLIKWVGEDKNMEDLNTETVTAYLYGGYDKANANWFCRYGAAKGFFLWAMARGYFSYLPLPTEMPTRPEHLQPYIYSDDELRRMFDTALTFQKNRSKVYPECIRMVLVLCYVLGLRLHESISLRIRDIDMDESIVHIRESKFYKSRLTPFNAQIKNLFKVFLSWRTANGMSDVPESFILLNKDGSHLDIETVRGAFQRIREKAGIRRLDIKQQPRIHDLRHIFAVNRLTAWYRKGLDVQQLLPVLSTYMGHKHLSHTSVYLTMTETLLGEASKRFESYANKHNSHGKR